jgi:hypothetical protein
MVDLATLLKETNPMSDQLLDPDFLARQQIYYKNYLALVELSQDNPEGSYNESIVQESREALLEKGTKIKIYGSVEHCYESLLIANAKLKKQMTRFGFWMNMHSQRTISSKLSRTSDFFLGGNLAETYTCFTKLHDALACQKSRKEYHYSNIAPHVNRAYNHFCALINLYVNAYDIFQKANIDEIPKNAAINIKNLGKLKSSIVQRPLESLTFYN